MVVLLVNLCNAATTGTLTQSDDIGMFRDMHSFWTMDHIGVKNWLHIQIDGNWIVHS